MKLLKNQKGMTLVELLAVLVILGIIAAIAIPMIGNVIEKSRDKADANEALNIINAAKMAYSNGEYGSGSPDPSTATEFSYTKTELESYVDVDITNNKYTVKFTKAKATDKSGTWTIVGHPASDKISGKDKAATEQQLKNAAK